MTNDIWNKFNHVDRFFLGSDRLAKQLTSAMQEAAVATGYPPYNIKKVDENKYVLELAVAGFGKHELALTLEENRLLVSGKTESTPESNYVYKGIADRAFSRSFTLADNVVIDNAELINGMLKIFLENVIPESKKPKAIEIKEHADHSAKKVSKEN